MELAARIGQSLLKKNKTLTERNELLEEQVEHIREEVRTAGPGGGRGSTRAGVRGLVLREPDSALQAAALTGPGIGQAQAQWLFSLLTPDRCAAPEPVVPVQKLTVFRMQILAHGCQGRGDRMSSAFRRDLRVRGEGADIPVGWGWWNRDGGQSPAARFSPFFPVVHQ